MKKTIIAIMYDFDKTLCTKDMQEYGFIPQIGMTPTEFWKEVKDLTDNEEMDNILAYMYKMVDKAKEKNILISKDTFKKLGESVEYFQGVETWFSRINLYGEKLGVNVEHYIVSSGIKEIIEGTSISKNFDKIYACEFMYDKTGRILWPKSAVNYTTKTQFLFRINKGVMEINTDSAEKLNDFTLEKDRRIPFTNMIYIGDGLTDVPCMKLVNLNGGKSIAVFNKEKGKESAQKLLNHNRVNFIAPADYTQNSEIDEIVKAIMKKIQVVSKLDSFTTSNY